VRKGKERRSLRTFQLDEAASLLEANEDLNDHFPQKEQNIIS
jgi:hypothetical protein